jgi:hypothetical protein
MRAPKLAVALCRANFSANNRERAYVKADASTHSQDGPDVVLPALPSNYRVEIASDFGNEMTSYDGFLVAPSPAASPRFSRCQNFGASKSPQHNPQDCFTFFKEVRRTVEGQYGESHMACRDQANTGLVSTEFEVIGLKKFFLLEAFVAALGPVPACSAAACPVAAL